MRFGDVIAAERKANGLSQKELASRIIKEDGVAISPQYLNDLERNRRNPPTEYIIERLAEELGLDPEYLFYVSGQMPPDLRDGTRPKEEVRQAFVAFRRELDKGM
jgi:transcriptional regulator with XRE-family HTH domain